MSEATSAGPPLGIPEHDLDLLVVRGRRIGALSMEDVVLVLQSVELTTDVIEGVRAHLLANGIVIDEAVPDVDELDEVPADPGPLDAADGPPPSIEAELHEASEAAFDAVDTGTFDQDGLELGG